MSEIAVSTSWHSQCILANVCAGRNPAWHRPLSQSACQVRVLLQEQRPHEEKTSNRTVNSRVSDRSSSPKPQTSVTAPSDIDYARNEEARTPQTLLETTYHRALQYRGCSRSLRKLRQKPANHQSLEQYQMSAQKWVARKANKDRIFAEIKHTSRRRVAQLLPSQPSTTQCSVSSWNFRANRITTAEKSSPISFLEPSKWPFS
jgi:hypothetical protein